MRRSVSRSAPVVASHRKKELFVMDRATIVSSPRPTRRSTRLFRFADVVLCVGIALAVGGFALGQSEPPPGSSRCDCTAGGGTLSVCGSCPGKSVISTECTQCCTENNECSSKDGTCGFQCSAEPPESGKPGKGDSKVIPAS